MKGKKTLSYLTALSMLFSQGISTISKASTIQQEDLNTESVLDEDYTPLQINTIFNSKEDLKISDYCELTLVSFIGDKILIPSFSYTYDILDNDEKNDYSESTVSISKIKTDFEINEYFNKFNEVEIAFEHSTKEPIFFRDLKTQEVFISNTFFEDLKKNPRYSKITEIRNVYDSEIKEKFQQDDDNLINLTGKLMSYSEYIENIYKKYIPKSYWPVNFNFKGNEINTTIPQLKDEIINQSLYDSDVGSIVVFDLKNNQFDIKHISLVKYNSKSRSFNDLFTNEEFSIPKKTYESVQLNRKALDYVSNSSFFLDFYTSKESNKYNILEIIQEMLWDSETVGDMVEGYKLLPMEYTFDYSNYDFTNNPNIVQSDKSSTIISPEGNFIADLDNVSLMPITNKPKIKELTRNS